jgi:streptomycin 6-kinase
MEVVLGRTATVVVVHDGDDGDGTEILAVAILLDGVAEDLLE